jgi:hypothetical protein
MTLVNIPRVTGLAPMPGSKESSFAEFEMSPRFSATCPVSPKQGMTAAEIP